MKELNLNQKVNETGASILVRDVVGFQLSHFYDYPLLTAEEEIFYAQKVRSAIRIGKDKNGRNTEIFDPTIEEADPDALRARERLVLHNQRLVAHYAQRYKSGPIAMPDLIQEGMIGLQRAAEKFDPTMGRKFSTYATCWIKQAMTRAIANDSRTIRLPNHQHERLNKIKKATAQLIEIHNRLPTSEEIAERLEITVEVLEHAIASCPKMVSLDLARGEKEDCSLGDAIPSPGNMAEETYASTDQQLAVKKMLDSLDPRSKDILMLRFGFDGCGPRSLLEVSEVYGISRERVRQIEKRAIASLRKCHKGAKDLLSA